MLPSGSGRRFPTCSMRWAYCRKRATLSTTPSSPTGPQPKSKALALAAGLIDQSRNAGDVTVDELVSLPVRKPNKGQFFRIHPTLHADVNLFKIESSSGTETYAVYPDMVGMLDGIQLYLLGDTPRWLVLPMAHLGYIIGRVVTIWPTNCNCCDGEMGTFGGRPFREHIYEACC